MVERGAPFSHLLSDFVLLRSSAASSSCEMTHSREITRRLCVGVCVCGDWVCGCDCGCNSFHAAAVNVAKSVAKNSQKNSQAYKNYKKKISEKNTKKSLFK